MKRTEHGVVYGGPFGKRKTIKVKVPETITEAIRVFGEPACLKWINDWIVIEAQRDARTKWAKRATDKKLAEIIFGKAKRTKARKSK